MTRQVKRRRGSTADHSTFTGAEAEFTYDSDLKTIRVHDGVQVGGFPLGRADAVGSDLVLSTTFRQIIGLWQVEYDALSVIDPNTLYIIIPPILIADNPGQLILDTTLSDATFTLI